MDGPVTIVTGTFSRHQAQRAKNLAVEVKHAFQKLYGHVPKPEACRMVLLPAAGRNSAGSVGTKA